MAFCIFFTLSFIFNHINAQNNDQFSAEASNYFASYSQATPINNGYATASQQQQNYGQPVPAAVQTKRTYEVKPYYMNSQSPPVPSIVDVQPSEQPVQVIFRTQSSPVMVQQIHTPSQAPMVEKTNSEDEPHRVLHEVVRPVIQQVREIIQPFRHVSQEIRPVLEEVHTVVAKGQKKQHINSFENQFSPVVMDQNLYPNGEYGQMALANEIVGQSVLANGEAVSEGTTSAAAAAAVARLTANQIGLNNKSNFDTNHLLELYMNTNHNRPFVEKAVNFEAPKTKRRIKARMSKKATFL